MVFATTLATAQLTDDKRNDAPLGNPPSGPGCSLISIYRFANKLLVVGLDQQEEKPTVAE